MPFAVLTGIVTTLVAPLPGTVYQLAVIPVKMSFVCTCNDQPVCSTGQLKVVDGAPTQGAAEQKAMEACRKAISDCRLLASGDGGCIALVLNAPKNKYVGGWGPTRDAAEAAALAAAGGGTVQPAHGHCLGDPVGAAGG